MRITTYSFVVLALICNFCHGHQGQEHQEGEHRQDKEEDKKKEEDTKEENQENQENKDNKDKEEDYSYPPPFEDLYCGSMNCYDLLGVTRFQIIKYQAFQHF